MESLASKLDAPTPLTSDQPGSSQPTSTFALADLPFDVAWEILAYLPKPAHIALALTCKSYWNDLAGRGFCQDMNPPLTPSEQRQLGILLERDLPNHCFCHSCLRLYCYSVQVGNLEQYKPHKCPEDQHQRDVQLASRLQAWCWVADIKSEWTTWEDFNQIAAVPFNEAHLVMRRHFCGGNCGLPVEKLQQCYEFERFPGSLHDSGLQGHFPLDVHPTSPLRLTRNRSKNLHPAAKSLLRTSKLAYPADESPCILQVPWMFKHEQTARIINDELYIRRVHRVIAPPALTNRAFIYHVLQLQLPICQHCRILDSCKFMNLRGGENNFLGPDPSRLCGLFVSPWQPIKQLFACSTCFTDCVLSVNKGNGIDGFWNLELTTYHRLGSCYSPASPEWLWLTTSMFYRDKQDGLLATHRKPSTAYCRSNTIKGGDIRRRWLQAEGRRGDDLDSALVQNDTRPAEQLIRDDMDFEWSKMTPAEYRVFV